MLLTARALTGLKLTLLSEQLAIPIHIHATTALKKKVVTVIVSKGNSFPYLPW